MDADMGGYKPVSGDDGGTGEDDEATEAATERAGEGEGGGRGGGEGEGGGGDWHKAWTATPLSPEQENTVVVAPLVISKVDSLGTLAWVTSWPMEALKAASMFAASAADAALNAT